MTLWLIGESPTRHTTEPFMGKTGRRLNRMIDFDVHHVFRCTNVLEEWPGPGRSKGSQFPIKEARKGAMRLLMDQELSPDDRLILVGGRVAQRAFKMDKNLPPYTWTTLRRSSGILVARPILDLQLCWIPHPSGVNQRWNDERNVQELRDFMQHLIGPQ